MDQTESLVDDPAQVQDLEGLVGCLRTLLACRDLSYSNLARAASALPKRNGITQALPRSTISDMLAGRRLPSRDKLLTFLAACRVSPDDVPQWLAAWDRVRKSLAPGTVPAARIAGPAETLPATDVVPPRKARRWWPLAAVASGTALVSVAATLLVLALTGAFGSNSGQILTVAEWNWTHWSPNSSQNTHSSSLQPGPHRFYCWTLGESFPHNGYASSYWVMTDDDMRQHVYINSLYLSGGDMGGLRRC